LLIINIASGVVFTTIQKFFTREKGDRLERVWKIAANATSSVWSSAFTRFFAPGRLKAELQT
jgi:hypothetical protein